jgi:glutathione S-transferase
MQIVIGNKNYSSWSMRPWVLAKEAGIPFEEVQLKFNEADGGLTVDGIDRFNVAGKVPVLVIDGEPVWDSLAICETLAERFPEKQLWPADRSARQVARSICAEMHSGFEGVRSAMPMNIRSSYPGKGMNEKSRRDIDRIVAIWTACREKFGKGGAMLFGRFSVADAYFAPVVMRFQTYAVDLPRGAQAYCYAVRGLHSVRAWMEGARKETEFVPTDEPYASRNR